MSAPISACLSIATKDVHERLLLVAAVDTQTWVRADRLFVTVSYTETPSKKKKGKNGGQIDKKD